MYLLTSTYLPSSSVKNAQRLPRSSHLAKLTALVFIPGRVLPGSLREIHKILDLPFPCIPIAHGFHRVDRAGLRIEAHDKVFGLIGVVFPFLVQMG